MALENFLGATAELDAGALLLLIVVLVWKLTWYGTAIYKTLEKKQKSWFVVLFIAAFVLNDLGILAIIYLIINRQQRTTMPVITKKTTKKRK